MRIAFYADPGHGWAAVPTALLQELGILDKITPYSYVSKDTQTVFLEEDCDLSTFMRAMEAQRPGVKVIFDDRHSKGESFIRHLPSVNSPYYKPGSFAPAKQPALF